MPVTSPTAGERQCSLVESFFGQPERERIGRRFSIARGAVGAEVLDCIGMFNTPDATLVQ
ncbi:hypothetical protein XabCFBP2524_17815 [Xanthomonas axonopodis pv. begoniae]|nr:hypothetical protein XabCFBP2524_17815 [Xanthomonas axonopodis pv. begoniae]